ncbi:efflux RND transporter periplasmic adaptor subunit [Paludisphaera mucosa]|uniref:Efflux RND transporter periplasmic adaptor subunit n=1 Tax=Paludisphaera mucosa TaxID=3030827 RepID=A0ABT6F7A1_9BACT|nr:efflux RND transporter periplasmic adaptor subunit [Paludisphaera mucosa]MDG3003462.1 efflux RND transporter periplasmic adaptor subunit [Paludisphaera mucosa]
MPAIGESAPPQSQPSQEPRQVHPDAQASAQGGRGSSSLRRTAVLLTLAIVGGGSYFVYAGKTPKEWREAVTRVWTSHPASPGAEPAAPARLEKKPSKPWNGLVDLDDEQIASIGVLVVPVRAQTEPIKLELTGRTAYNENSLTKIRPRFDTLVVGVLAEKGRRVKKGDPLVELYSTELASAKNRYQINYVQWQHDLRFLKVREKLVKTGAISEQTYVDTINEESKSRLDYLTAWENLRILGVPETEIDPLTAHLGEASSAGDLLNVADKAKMTLRSPVDGIVIQREVVPGNLYDNNDVLLVVAPLDQLWVWANVYERDQAKVKLGQRMNIQFPFLDRTFAGTVEYVSSEVSKDSRAIQVRASIPNPDSQLKADMLVRTVLDVPPIAGQTVIPRVSMVMLHGEPFVFVRNPAAEKDVKTKLFERRRITPAQENTDTVIVHDGLKDGEEVVSNGSLILAQLYEDRQISASGTPPE